MKTIRIEIRNNSINIDGYVNAVGRDSNKLAGPSGIFIEQIVPKTFEKALEKTSEVKLLFNHKENRVLGTTKTNLKLYEDNIGLRAIATIEDEEVVKKAKENKLTGWSFGFVALKDKWEETNGINKRFIEDMELLEVSILDKTPAYTGTSIETREDKTLIVELRNNDFKANIIDFSKENEKQIDFSKEKAIIEILKIKGV